MPAIVGLIVVLVLVGAGAMWLTKRSDSAATPQPGPTLLSSTPPAQPATLQESRVVEVHGRTVNVSESTTVVSGGPVTVVPSTKPPALGLSESQTVVVGQDGSNQPFTTSTTLAVGRTLTVEGRYQLTDCPDLLPTQWPSPTTIRPGHWSRTFTKVSVPQRTSRALCPTAKSKAAQPSTLSGSMSSGKQPSVRLLWSGSKPVTVTAIGSASGVAAIGVGPRCPGTCVAQLVPGTSATIRLHPLEQCPVAGRTDTLTLRLTVKGRSPQTLGVRVKQLGQRVCD